MAILSNLYLDFTECAGWGVRVLEFAETNGDVSDAARLQQMNSRTVGHELKSSRLHAAVGMNWMLRVQPCPYVSTGFPHQEVKPRLQYRKLTCQYNDASSTLGAGHGCMHTPTRALHVHAHHEPAWLSSGVDVLTPCADLTA